MKPSVTRLWPGSIGPKDDLIIDGANVKYDTGEVSAEVIESNNIDTQSTNKVHYLYVNKELFQNEM